MWGCDRRRGAAVGVDLRNACKVSERSGRHKADNPAHHATVPSPITPSSLSLKPTRVGLTPR